MTHTGWRGCLVGFLTAVVAFAANGCSPNRSKEDRLKAQFAVGANWLNAILKVEQVVGPAQSFMGSCTTDLGVISFNKLPKGEYLLNYPVRGAGASGVAMPQGPEAFAAALGAAFVHSRCTHAEFQYDQYSVVVDVPATTITSMSVSRAK